MKKILFSIAIIFGAFLWSENAMAQKVKFTPSKDGLASFKHAAHFELIPEQDAWVTGANPAGLMNIPVKRDQGLSYVESYFDYKDGGWVKYYESDNNYTFGVKTESYTRVKNVATHGFLEYSSFRGHNMTWSGVIDPERLTNFTGDTSAASKRQEWYRVGGGAAFNPVKRLTLGTNVVFEASNVAKMRDLRHNTDFSRLSFDLGAKFSTKWVDFGVNYLYKKYTEDVKYEQISDESHTFAGNWFKGLFFGIHNIWDYDALAMKSQQTFIDKYNGVSGQAEIKLDKAFHSKFRIYNEFTYTKRKGQTGEGGVEPVASKENGEKFAYTMSVRSAYGSTTFYIDYDKVTNNDQVTTTQNLNGNTIILHYGEAQVFQRREHRWGLNFKGYLGMRGLNRGALNPRWSGEAGFERWSRFSNSSYVMPLYYTQEIKRNTFYATLKRNFMLKWGMIDLRAGARYDNGWGSKLEEHTADKDVTILTGRPSCNNYLLSREFEYYTKPVYSISGGARYSHFVSRKFSGSWYVDLAAALSKARYVAIANGTKFGNIRISVGLNF